MPIFSLLSILRLPDWPHTVPAMKSNNVIERSFIDQLPYKVCKYFWINCKPSLSIMVVPISGIVLLTSNSLKFMVP
jgi:hypothetical protein